MSHVESSRCGLSASGLESALAGQAHLDVRSTLPVAAPLAAVVFVSVR